MNAMKTEIFQEVLLSICLELEQATPSIGTFISPQKYLYLLCKGCEIHCAQGCIHVSHKGKVNSEIITSHNISGVCADHYLGNIKFYILFVIKLA